MATEPDRKNSLRVCVLTTPSGAAVVEHLLAELQVVGVLIDVGRSPRRDVSWLGRAARALRREGVAGVFRNLAGHWTLRRARARDENRWGELTRQYPIPFERVADVNDSVAVSKLRDWRPDLGIIAGGRILEPDVIGVPRLGFINKHSSLLPRHRGLAAEFWCLYYEDLDALGITVHFVSPGVDDGPILVQRPMCFRSGDTPERLRARSEEIGRESLVEAARQVASGDRGVAQDEALATRNSRPTPQQERELRAKLPQLWRRFGEA